MDDHADGNIEQTRVIAKAIARQMIEVYGDPEKVTVPSPLKWAAGIVAAVMTVGASGLLFWMVTTISSVQLTVVRIDERQAMNTKQWSDRFTSIEQRMDRLEAQQRARILP